MSQMIEMHSADHCVVVAELATSLKDLKFSKQSSVWKRSIFQTFWKQDCCARLLFIELETSNFGYLLIF